MTSTLSNLVDNLAEGIHKIKYKYGTEIEQRLYTQTLKMI